MMGLLFHNGAVVWLWVVAGVVVGSIVAAMIVSKLRG
jgi:hypothetical protein